MSGLTDRAAGAARSNILTFPLLAAAGLLTSVVVVRELSKDDYAVFALALAVSASAQFVIDMGTGAASSRLFAELQRVGARDQARRLFARLAAVRFGVLVLAAIPLAVAPDFFLDLLGLDEDETYVLVFLVLIAFCEIVSMLGFYVLSGTLGHPAINRINLVQRVVLPVLVIGAAAAAFGLEGILVAYLVAGALKALALTVFAFRAVRQIPDTGEHVEDIRSSYVKVAASSATGKAASWVHSRQFVTPVVMASTPRPEVASFALAYDWAHQALSLISGPFYSMLLPTFAGAEHDLAMTERFFRFATRSLALVTLTAAAALVAVFPSLATVLAGSDYADAYPYAVVIICGFAYEVVFSGPPTALLLASPALSATYGRIRVVVLAIGPVYLLLAGVNLLIVAVVMMAVRVAAATALQVAVHRRFGNLVDVRWVVRAFVAAAIATGAGIAARIAVPGDVADLFVVPAVAAGLFLALVRLGHLLLAADAAVAIRVLPAGRRVLQALSSEIASR